MCGPVNGSYYSFIKGTFYAAKTVRGVIETDAWTGLPKMIRKDYRRLCVYPLNFLDRQVVVYPADSSRSSFLIIDPDAPITVKDINIPYYLKANDVVRVKLNTRTLLVQAKQVNHEKQCFHGHELRQVRGCSDRFNILSRTITFNCCDVLNVVSHRYIAGYVYIDSN